MTAPQTDPLAKARTQLMTGAMIVMGACVFGGLTAVPLMALGQRMAAGVIAVIAAIIIVVGIVIQVGAAKRLKTTGGGSK